MIGLAEQLAAAPAPDPRSSPPAPSARRCRRCCRAGTRTSTSSTASSSVIMKRVMAGSVIGDRLAASGPARRTAGSPSRARPSRCRSACRRSRSASASTLRDLATMTFSIIALEMPMALIGYTALSVLRQTTRCTPLAIAASSTFSVPRTLVLHRLHRMELAGRHLLQRRRVKDVVDAAHGARARCRSRARRRCRTSACRCDRRLRMSSCFFSSRLKIADLADVRVAGSAQDGVAERAGAAGDQKDRAIEHSGSLA